jgi:hypothetical protein
MSDGGVKESLKSLLKICHDNKIYPTPIELINCLPMKEFVGEYFKFRYVYGDEYYIGNT